MNFKIECAREEDGRWLAEVPQFPGVLAYGQSPNEAMGMAQMLALRVLHQRDALDERPAQINLDAAAPRPGMKRQG